MSEANVYRILKEDFVTGLTGSTIGDVVTVTSISVSSGLLWSVLKGRYGWFSSYDPAAAVTDYILNCATVLCCMTVYARFPGLLHLCLLGPAVVLLILAGKQAKPKSRPKPKPKPKTDGETKPDVQLQLPRKDYITNYRGGMMVLTCIAILAIDFPVFPRRFGKVETWGVSVMDMGVGSFAFARGLVAARSMLRRSVEKREWSVRMGWRAFVSSCKNSIVPVLMGVARVLSVKRLDYQEHVSEYGVHWNFFFTLALLGPLVAVIDIPLGLVTRPPRLYRPSLVSLSAVAALVLAAGYQTVLSTTLLQGRILNARRVGWFWMNREGICSLAGYVAIFLAGRDTGLVVLQRDTSFKKSGLPSLSWWTSRVIETDVGQLGLRLLVWSGLYYYATQPQLAIPGPELEISRRLTNMPYVLFVVALNQFQILLAALVERLAFSHHQLYSVAVVDSKPGLGTSPLLWAFNKYGDLVFLLANILTGLVNMSMMTTEKPREVSMPVLVAYTAVLSAVALAGPKFVARLRKKESVKKRE